MEDIKKLHDELLVIDIDICVNQLEELKKELSRVGRKWGYGAKRSANEINEDIEKTKKKHGLLLQELERRATKGKKQDRILKKSWLILKYPVYIVGAAIYFVWYADYDFFGALKAVLAIFALSLFATGVSVFIKEIRKDIDKL